MSQPKKLYFAYGSNMDVQQMSYRCPNAEVVRSVRLENYRLAYRGAGYATILPEQGSHVDGVLWSITTIDEIKLDRYEGFPRHYAKQRITVKAKDGTEIEAMVYVMQPPMRDHPKLPSQEYFDTVLRGKQQFGFSVPDTIAEINRTYQEICTLTQKQKKGPPRTGDAR